jgi:N-acetylglutamate synthase-like GNAT family acetyltransferase
MITFRKATQHDIRALSQKLLTLLEDEDSQICRENVAKFGIPKEYVKRAFSGETLLEAVASGKSTFCLALENGCKILGFAQITQQHADIAELERIVVFPEYGRKDMGTQLLANILRDQKQGETKESSSTLEKTKLTPDDFTRKMALRRQKRQPWTRRGVTS